jgi:hypothetical protein
MPISQSEHVIRSICRLCCNSCGVLKSLAPRTVVLDYAWWYPEKKASHLFAWDESNINVLTSNKPPFNREMGTSSLRGIFCKVSKVEP